MFLAPNTHLKLGKTEWTVQSQREKREMVEERDFPWNNIKNAQWDGRFLVFKV